MDTYRACARTHVHSRTHTHIRTNTLQSSVMVLPVPLPCPPLPTTLFLPCAYSEKCNGFRSFRECCGVKNLYCVLSLFCSITAELRSKLSLLCILFLLFLQHPAPPLSMSAFDMHVKKKKVYLLLKKRRRRKKGWMLNCCFRLCVVFFFFTSVFHLLPSPSHFPPDLNERKASTLSIVEGCLERTCERKSILRRMSLELCWLGQQFIIIDDVVYIVAHD